MPEMTDEQIEAVKDTCRSIVQNMEGDSLFGSALGAITTLQRQRDGMQIMAEGFKAQLTEALAAKDAMQAAMGLIEVLVRKGGGGSATQMMTALSDIGVAVARFVQPAPDPRVKILADALRETDPEGCDDEWSYEPQAERMLSFIAARGLRIEGE